MIFFDFRHDLSRFLLISEPVSHGIPQDPSQSQVKFGENLFSKWLYLRDHTELGELSVHKSYVA